MRELYHVPGVAATVTPRYYVISYYSIDASQSDRLIIPKGTPVDLAAPHDRARLLELRAIRIDGIARR